MEGTASPELVDFGAIDIMTLSRTNNADGARGGRTSETISTRRNKRAMPTLSVASSPGKTKGHRLARMVDSDTPRATRARQRLASTNPRSVREGKMEKIGQQPQAPPPQQQHSRKGPNAIVRRKKKPQQASPPYRKPPAKRSERKAGTTNNRVRLDPDQFHTFQRIGRRTYNDSRYLRRLGVHTR